MIDIYFPQIVKYVHEQYRFPQETITFELMSNVVFNFKSDLHDKYKYYISYVPWEISNNGININNLYKYILNKIPFNLKTRYCDLNKNNSCIHIYNNGYSIYYPEYYEYIVNNNWISDQFINLSMNEYIIKNIIE